MAVYSFINDSDLRLIEAQFEFGKITAARPIAEGVENTNYLLEAEAANGVSTKYILTIFEQRVSEADLPFFLYLKQYLRENGYNCPSPIPNQAGELYFRLQGKPATLVSFLYGKSIEPPRLEHIQQAGEWLGRLHQTARNFNMARRNSVAYADWIKLRDKIARRASASQHLEWLALIDDELTVQSDFWQNQALPSGVIHADFFPNNVFFDESEQLCGVIDFYFACNDAFAYDLAIVANAWCFEADLLQGKDFQLNADYLSALMQHYQQIRPLEMKELQAMPILLRSSSLRFLLTRLHDVLYTAPDALVQPHDPNEYVQKLLHWREN
jgi:homoserine kinase type II